MCKVFEEFPVLLLPLLRANKHVNSTCKMKKKKIMLIFFYGAKESRDGGRATGHDEYIKWKYKNNAHFSVEEKGLGMTVGWWGMTCISTRHVMPHPPTTVPRLFLSTKKTTIFKIIFIFSLYVLFVCLLVRRRRNSSKICTLPCGVRFKKRRSFITFCILNVLTVITISPGTTTKVRLVVVDVRLNCIMPSCVRRATGRKRDPRCCGERD